MNNIELLLRLFQSLLFTKISEFEGSEPGYSEGYDPVEEFKDTFAIDTEQYIKIYYSNVFSPEEISAVRDLMNILIPNLHNEMKNILTNNVFSMLASEKLELTKPNISIYGILDEYNILKKEV